MYPAPSIRITRLHYPRFPDCPILLGTSSPSSLLLIPKTVVELLTQANTPILILYQVVLLLVLEMLVSSLIVTAILKGSNTGFRKTDKLMKKIAMCVRVPYRVLYDRKLIFSVAVQAQILPILG